MTTAQKNGIKYALAILGACGAVIFTAGFSLRRLDTKEEQADHAADIRTLDNAIRIEANTRALQQVRDSAQMSVVLDRLNDIACLQNPSRRYCR